MGRLKYLTPCVAIVAITLLMSIALLKGINGSLLSMAFIGIGGLGGYSYYKARSGK